MTVNPGRDKFIDFRIRIIRVYGLHNYSFKCIGADDLIKVKALTHYYYLKGENENGKIKSDKRMRDIVHTDNNNPSRHCHGGRRK